METSTYQTEIHIYTRNEAGKLNWESPKVVTDDITIVIAPDAASWEDKVRKIVKAEAKKMEGTRFYFTSVTQCGTKAFSNNL